MLNNLETRTKIIVEIMPISAKLRAKYAAVVFLYLDRLLQALNFLTIVARLTVKLSHHVSPRGDVTNTPAVREVLVSKEFGLTVAFQDEI
jgi:hypothetical protein